MNYQVTAKCDNHTAVQVFFDVASPEDAEAMMFELLDIEEYDAEAFTYTVEVA